MKVLRSVTYVAESELKTFLVWHSWVDENCERLITEKNLFFFISTVRPVIVQNLLTTSITLFLTSFSEITIHPNLLHFLFCTLEHITIR